MITDYILIEHPNPKEVEKRVKDLIKGGYTLHGTLVAGNGVFVQALIQRKVEAADVQPRTTHELVQARLQREGEVARGVRPEPIEPDPRRSAHDNPYSDPDPYDHRNY